MLGLTEEEFDRTAEDIADDLEDFGLIKNKLVYEVWLIGYDADMNATDFEWYIDGEYTEEVEARKCFEYLSDKDNLNEFIETRNVIIPDNTKHVHLMLEMCVELEDGSKECQDIIDEVEIY